MPLWIIFLLTENVGGRIFILLEQSCLVYLPSAECPIFGLRFLSIALRDANKVVLSFMYNTGFLMTILKLLYSTVPSVIIFIIFIYTFFMWYAFSIDAKENSTQFLNCQI